MRLPIEFTDFRRGGAMLVPVVVLIAILGWDWGFHGPAHRRTERLTAEAGQLGISLGPTPNPTLVPPPVRSLLEANAMEAARLAELQRTGALAADLLKVTTDLSNRSGVRVVATEPGVALTEGDETIVRAHVRAIGTYAEFVRFLDTLARGDRLIAIDQFTMTPTSGGELSLDLRVSRLVVKHNPGGGATP